MKSVYQLLAAKRDGQELTESEINFLVNQYTAGNIKDYQFSAFLMAAFINGLSAAETSALTSVMLNSGETVRIANPDRPLIDKHSTGGVGDKLSLIICPILADCGIAVGMFSGRALGHTGGTLDKLESIPGMKVFHSAKRFEKLIKKHHFAISGQTNRIAPADKKIYALRDATGTVESIPLIVASIMSKKLALKSDGIVFDVKTGSGAFMKKMTDSIKLAKALVEIAERCNLPARAAITDMDQPTGQMIGNFLEVKESIDVLRGDGPKDTIELTVEIAALMLQVAGVENSHTKAKRTIRDRLRSGHGFEAFCRYISDCDGDVKVLEKPERMFAGVHKRIVKAKQSGYIESIHTARLGFISGSLGAGRSSIMDKIDPTAGIEINIKIGDQVRVGDSLATVYSQDRQKLDPAARELSDMVTISDREVKRPRLVRKRI